MNKGGKLIFVESMLRSDETAQSPSQTLKKYASPAKEKYSCLPAAKSLEDSAPPNRLPSLQMPAIFWTMPRRRMTIRFNRAVSSR